MKIQGIFVAALFLMTLGLATAQAEDSALDQLQGMQNTGMTFDGSDGERSGMDTWTTPSSGSIPDVPEPTPVEPVTYEPAPEPEPTPVEPVTYEPAPEPEPAPMVEPTPEPAPEPEPDQGPVTGEEVA